MKISELIPDQRNANKGTKRGAEMIEDSLRKYGAGRSILIDKNRRVIAGNKTLENAGQIGMEDVIVVQTDGTKIVAVQRMDLDLAADAKAKELAIADNRAGQVSLDWDSDVLVELAQECDLSGMFSDDELAALIPEQVGELLTDEDEVPAPPAEPETKPGDLYILGKHRLLCGDSTNIQHVERLMDGKERFDLCLTDPPYGLGGGKKSGKNAYDIHEDSRENLIELANGWLPIARQIAPAVVFSPGVTNAWIYPEADWIICWFYGGGQLRSSWGFNCWQPFLCYGKDPSLASGNGGRPDAVNMNTPANASDLDHPCPKPVALWEWFISRLTFQNGATIYEPFGGSGTGIVAAEKTGRVCYSMELSPRYCDVIVTRWENATGKKAVRNG